MHLVYKYSKGSLTLSDLEIPAESESASLWQKLVDKTGPDTYLGALVETTLAKSQTANARSPVHPGLLQLFQDAASLSERCFKHMRCAFPDIPSPSTIKRANAKNVDMAAKDGINFEGLKALRRVCDELNIPEHERVIDLSHDEMTGQPVCSI